MTTTGDSRPTGPARHPDPRAAPAPVLPTPVHDALDPDPATSDGRPPAPPRPPRPTDGNRPTTPTHDDPDPATSDGRPPAPPRPPRPSDGNRRLVPPTTGRRGPRHEPPESGDERPLRGAPERIPPMVRRLAAELTGTAFLVGGVVGSGIMAERLSDDPGLQLLQNAAATAGVLVALILALGPASGAHFNPAVTLVDRAFGGLDTPAAVGYVIAQVTGGIVGAVAANVMFGLPVVEWSATERSAGSLWFAEAVATLGLVVVIFGVVRSGRSTAAAFAVGGYIAGAYYFTSSTSFANPAVTIARAFSDTFAGISPASVPAFVAAQLAGAALAAGLVLVIYPRIGEVAADVVVPRDTADRADRADESG